MRGGGSSGVMRKKHFYDLVFVFAGGQLGGWFDAVQIYSEKVNAMFFFVEWGINN